MNALGTLAAAMLRWNRASNVQASWIFASSARPVVFFKNRCRHLHRSFGYTIEALSFGCAVISMARACICEDFAGIEEVLVLDVPDFVAWAAERIVQIVRSPERPSLIAANARRSFDLLKAKANHQFANLLERMTGPLDQREQ